MKKFGPYTPVFSSGNVHFISGQIGVDPETGSAAENIEKQTHQALTNMKNLLEQHDLQMGDIVKTTIFLTDMGEFAAVNEIYQTYFPEPRPARSCVAVKELPRIGENPLKIEIEAIAKK